MNETTPTTRSPMNLCSPCCKSELRATASELQCKRCAKKFPVQQGIPLFAQDMYWGKVPSSTLQSAIDMITRDGWVAFTDAYAGKFDFSEATDRADWRFSIPIRKDWTILDTGAGMGRNTIPLAKIAGHVVAFDTSHIRLRFIQELAKKNRLDNVTIFVADFFDLPLPDHSFDLIALNGVLEWVGKTNRFTNPRDAQLEALRICKRLLKPNGYLYIGIENRISYVYLHAHDHGGLYYSNYLPRLLANMYSHIMKSEPYQTYTYSQTGYEKLLEEAGFTNNCFYVAFPGYNHPRIIFPYNNIPLIQFTLQYLLNRNSFKGRVLGTLSRSTFFTRILRMFSYSFNIISQV